MSLDLTTGRSRTLTWETDTTGSANIQYVLAYMFGGRGGNLYPDDIEGVFPDYTASFSMGSHAVSIHIWIETVVNFPGSTVQVTYNLKSQISSGSSSNTVIHQTISSPVTSMLYSGLYPPATYIGSASFNMAATIKGICIADEYASVNPSTPPAWGGAIGDFPQGFYLQNIEKTHSGDTGVVTVLINGVTNTLNISISDASIINYLIANTLKIKNSYTSGSIYSYNPSGDVYTLWADPKLSATITADTKMSYSGSGTGSMNYTIPAISDNGLTSGGLTTYASMSFSGSTLSLTSDVTTAAGAAIIANPTATSSISPDVAYSMDSSIFNGAAATTNNYTVNFMQAMSGPSNTFSWSQSGSASNSKTLIDYAISDSLTYTGGPTVANSWSAHTQQEVNLQITSGSLSSNGDESNDTRLQWRLFWRNLGLLNLSDSANIDNCSNLALNGGGNWQTDQSLNPIGIWNADSGLTISAPDTSTIQASATATGNLNRYFTLDPGQATGSVNPQLDWSGYRFLSVKLRYLNPSTLQPIAGQSGYLSITTNGWEDGSNRILNQLRTYRVTGATSAELTAQPTGWVTRIIDLMCPSNIPSGTIFEGGATCTETCVDTNLNLWVTTDTQPFEINGQETNVNCASPSPILDPWLGGITQPRYVLPNGVGGSGIILPVQLPSGWQSQWGMQIQMSAGQCIQLQGFSLTREEITAGSQTMSCLPAFYGFERLNRKNESYALVNGVSWYRNSTSGASDTPLTTREYGRMFMTMQSEGRMGALEMTDGEMVWSSSPTYEIDTLLYYPFRARLDTIGLQNIIDTYWQYNPSTGNNDILHHDTIGAYSQAGFSFVPSSQNSGGMSAENSGGTPASIDGWLTGNRPMSWVWGGGYYFGGRETGAASQIVGAVDYSDAAAYRNVPIQVLADWVKSYPEAGDVYNYSANVYGGATKLKAGKILRGGGIGTFIRSQGWQFPTGSSQTGEVRNYADNALKDSAVCVNNGYFISQFDQPGDLETYIDPVLPAPPQSAASEVLFNGSSPSGGASPSSAPATRYAWHARHLHRAYFLLIQGVYNGALAIDSPRGWLHTGLTNVVSTYHAQNIPTSINVFESSPWSFDSVEEMRTNPRDGSLLALGLTGTNAFSLWHSMDGGETGTEILSMTARSAAIERDSERGAIICIWENSGQLQQQVSYNEGVTWSSPLGVTSGGSALTGQIYASTQNPRSGRLFLSLGVSGASTVYYSDDLGETFTIALT